MTVDEHESCLFEFESLSGNLAYQCVYGENRWQKEAALYDSKPNDVLALPRFKHIDGAVLSYNNWADIDRLLQTITHIAAVFEKNGMSVPCIAVGGKHGNACGADIGANPLEALTRMLGGDKLAIFGGVVMTNFPITMGEGETMREWGTEFGVKRILDCVVAPSIDEEGKRELTRKGGKCRMVVNPALESIGLGSLDTSYRVRPVRGGFLLQENYISVFDRNDPELRCIGEIGDVQWPDVYLAWAVGSTSNSNTITLVRNAKLIGNAVGQQDRVGAAQLALRRAERGEHVVALATAYSDSFFPFVDGPRTLITAGVRTILATSGSVNDDQVVELCRRTGTTLLLLPDAKARGFFGH